MPKLYFRYGTMNSSKTANMLMASHNYKSYGRCVLLGKPALDNRDGASLISSRTGLECMADLLISPDTDILKFVRHHPSYVSCFLVDEAQFLTAENINQLRELTKFIPVICYGLRTDYKSELFPGSKRLMEISDSIEEIKTICVKCNSKAIINAKFTQNKEGVRTIIIEGSSEPDLGAEEKYQAMCWTCWSK
jgi:thymidine kinase